MKIICESCESCETVFKAEAVKGMTNCPVCGAAFDEEEGNANNQGGEEREIKAPGSLMYFYENKRIEYSPEDSIVCCCCKECNALNELESKKFKEIVDKKYAILKEGIVFQCYRCKKEHKPRKIVYRKKEFYVPQFAHCPACNSIMLEKIKSGIFSSPYNTKTFKCKNCGYRF